jgi:formylglycine-generating enzyme required for sulfatase activity
MKSPTWQTKAGQNPRGGLNAKRFPLGDIISFEVSNYLSLGGLNYDAAFMSGYRPPSQDVGWPYIWRVGSFGANSFGLHEMAGNLSEWCWDWYGVYVLGSQADPYGATYGTSRILRGGSWDADARYCRVANRNSDAPSNSSFSTGFRVIRRDVDSDSDGLFDWVETNTGIYIYQKQIRGQTPIIPIVMVTA